VWVGARIFANILLASAMPEEQSTSFVGQPLSRVDGRAKVTGRARYATEDLPENVAHAVAVNSGIAAGRIQDMDTAEAEKAPGVLAVITHRNAPRLARPTLHPAGQSLPVLQGPEIQHYGQFIAVVVAETFEQARHASSLVRVNYEPRKAQTFATGREHAIAPSSGQTVRQTKADNRRGDPQRGFSEATTIVDAVYRTPIQHHCAMESHATLAWWEAGRLHAHDATENYVGTRQLLAEVFGLEEESVHVFTEFVGGSFGSKGQSWPHVILAALAAQHVGRPVKLALARQQTFTNAGHRTPTEQRLALGAAADGGLTATRHDSIMHTSQFDEFVEPCGQHTELLYSCPNVAVSHRIVRANVGTPTFTRGPGETPGSFALESAMDELAIALKMDPVKLRERCDAERDEHVNRPWSSRRLKECYALAAEKFGWAERNPEPRSMRDGRWLIGWGMATTTLGSSYRKAEARARFQDDGQAVIECATHEIGVGNYTILTQIAADSLAIPMERVTIALGDSRFPPTPRGGSPAASSVGSAVLTAARDLRAQLIGLALEDRASPLHGLKHAELEVKSGRVFEKKNPARGELYTEILARRGLRSIAAKAVAQPGRERGQPSASALVGGSGERTVAETDPAKAGKKSAPEPGEFSFHSFGAHFCEVAVDADLGMARVRRWVGAFDCGRILNPKTATSQVSGGIVWGIGNALMEGLIQDPRDGAFINTNLAEYHVATCADVPAIEVHFLDGIDERANPLGVKSVGELGNVGSAAAIANAIFHATGRRVRDLPITPDKLLV
jgi:xanthine dehydrogenase YagR molybdenum-binding subunit